MAAAVRPGFSGSGSRHSTANKLQTSWGVGSGLGGSGPPSHSQVPLGPGRHSTLAGRNVCTISVLARQPLELRATNPISWSALRSRVSVLPVLPAYASAS